MNGAYEGPCSLVYTEGVPIAEGNPRDGMGETMTAEEIKQLLKLEPHPCEGGWYVRTYESGDAISEAALGPRYVPGSSRRHIGTAIYYLLEPDTFSEMHRLASDEIFHFYLGDPVEMLQLPPNGPAQITILGSDLARGQTPQHVVPHGVWQGSRLVQGGSFALLGCTVAPGFEYRDYESGSASELCAGWPQHAEMIAGLTRFLVLERPLFTD